MSASSKPLWFISGLVLGVLAGAGFFVLKMNNALKGGNILEKSKDTTSIYQQANNTLTEQKNEKEIKKYIDEKDTTQKMMNSAEMLAAKYSKEVPINKVMAEADSLLKETGSANVHHQTKDVFIVRKDELLDIRTLEVLNLQQNEIPNSSDSLLQKVSGIKDQKKNIIASFKIEFWQSPINYKGYKMSKNKIVLFGIQPEENIKLYLLNENIFMKLNQNVFKMSYTDDFKQLEKESDAITLSKLSR